MPAPPASSPVLTFAGVAKDFDAHPAVVDLNLSVSSGEIFGLIGPNGAGKTTTIKMAVGLLGPSRGTISICGHDVHRRGESARRHLGFVPDSAPLYEKLSGREMLDLAADLHGVTRERRRRRIPALVEALDLAPIWGQLIQSYSRGMRQRLALCAALVHDPEVLFLDEPTAGLDPRAARRLQELLRALRGTGHAVFLSTHSLAVAAAICDRVGIFDSGRMVSVGTVAELAPAGSGTVDALETAFLAATDAGGASASDLAAALSS